MSALVCAFVVRPARRTKLLMRRLSVFVCLDNRLTLLFGSCESRFSAVCAEVCHGGTDNVQMGPEKESAELPGAKDSEGSLRQRAYRCLESGHAQGRIGMVDAALVLLIVLNVAAVLLASMGDIDAQYATQFRWFEIFSVSVFTIEYLLRLWVCVESNGLQIGESAKRFRYALTPMALIDLAAVLPFYLAFFGLLGPADARLLRVLRLLRLFKLTRYADSISLLFQVLRENATNFAAAFGVLLVVMVFAASGMYLIEHDVQPDVFGSIPSAMWWAFVTLTTVGYGDVTPVTPLGKFFGAGITVVSIGIVALPAGLLASSFSARLLQNSEAYRGAADEVVADGVITEEERKTLEEKRRQLGLGEDLAEDILEEERARRDSETVFGICPTCGQGLKGPGG